MNRKDKALKFVEHIEKHLEEMFPLRTRGRGVEYRIYQPKVICKICGKTIDEIAGEKVEGA